MKVGDNLYCIKDYISVGKIVNTKGQIYKIIDIRDFYYISVNTNYKNDSLCDSNNFIIGNNTPEYNLYEFFIDLKESRKLKLEKINEKR